MTAGVTTSRYSVASWSCCFGWAYRVVVDPSHAAGRPELIVPLSLAAAAAGADGILVEVHPRPDEALCDGAQALQPGELRDLVARLGPVAEAVGRTLWKPSHAARRAAAR